MTNEDTQTNVDVHIETNEDIQDAVGEETEIVEELADEKKESAGKRLREAREALGLSQEDVAHRLHFKANLVDALENEDLTGLPEPTYICGYLRGYTRLLGLPSDEIIDSYPHLREKMALILSVKPVGSTAVDEKSSSLVFSKRYILITVAAIVLLIILGWQLVKLLNIWEDVDDSSSEVESVIGQTTPDNRVEEQKATLEKVLPLSPKLEQEPVSKEKNEAPALHSVLGGESIKLESDQTKNNAEPVFPPKQVLSQNENLTEKQNSPVIEKQVKAEEKDKSIGVLTRNSELVLKFVKDSWAEVYDANGQTLLYKLGKAPLSRVVRGKAPFKLVLGFAPGVIIEYNGTPYDMSDYKGSVVASLQIGKADDNKIRPIPNEE